MVVITTVAPGSARRRSVELDNTNGARRASIIFRASPAAIATGLPDSVPA